MKFSKAINVLNVRAGFIKINLQIKNVQNVRKDAKFVIIKNALCVWRSDFLKMGFFVKNVIRIVKNARMEKLMIIV